MFPFQSGRSDHRNSTNFYKLSNWSKGHSLFLTSLFRLKPMTIILVTMQLFSKSCSFPQKVSLSDNSIFFLEKSSRIFQKRFFEMMKYFCAFWVSSRVTLPTHAVTVLLFPPFPGWVLTNMANRLLSQYSKAVNKISQLCWVRFLKRFR